MGTVFSIVSALHNIFRWVVILLALFALYRAYTGWLGRKEYTASDRKAGVFFTSALDTQMLLGVILLLFGGLSLLQYGWILHIIPMVVGIGIAHVSFVLSRRGSDPLAKQRTAALGYTVAVIVILVSIPWYLKLFPGA